MKVELWLQKTSQPLKYENVENTYTKGGFYCIYTNEKVYKFPQDHIFRVIEDYK